MADETNFDGGSNQQALNAQQVGVGSSDPEHRVPDLGRQARSLAT